MRANPDNGLVIFVDDVAAVLSLLLRDLFTPDYRWLRILLNDGLAALVLARPRTRHAVMLVRSLR